MAGKRSKPEQDKPQSKTAAHGENSSPIHPAMKPPWRPGQSGNPKGKPKGALHRATRAVMELMNGEAESITRKAIEKAKEGDMVALKLVLDRIAPAVKSRAIRLNLPPINTPGDILKAQTATAKAMAEGEITPDEAATVASILETKRRTFETIELEQRLAKIEQAIQVRK